MRQLAQLFQHTTARLEQAGIEDARQEALQLFEHCLGLGQNDLLLRPELVVGEQKAGLLAIALARRLTREPLQYITGTREFWSLGFIVTPAVLIPRPETEFLLDRVLAVLRTDGYNGGPVLDMCTGSGVIAAILALELDAGSVIAVDSSYAALRVAVQNWKRHGRDGVIQPLCADLFTAFRHNARFELIVANPPYVAEADLVTLQPEVRDWEPKTALFAGPRGFSVIEQLACHGHEFLRAGGWLFMEIGSDQETEAHSLFTGQAEKRYERVEVLRDWSGRPRVLQARKTG
ncbi:MAG TPA: peptide chain release factor N(5)-glutamine methyltransferase [Desulfobulbaceae bacterium]|nr:peptide chain release factor N(5)-glutamine methyltransferase [Desulfobulbaceae bacterium]